MNTLKPAQDYQATSAGQCPVSRWFRPLYKRSLAIYEKALGPEHPHEAKLLEYYADVLRETGRDDQAARMEVRAKAIRANSE